MSTMPFPTSNNAPLPVPGGYGNPTGANTGFLNFSKTPGSNLPFPTMSAYGQTGPAYNIGAYGTGAGLAGLNSGFSTNDPGRTQNLYNYLGKAYGKGPGQLLGNMITQGLFNPQVAAAFLNAQAPGIARGEAGIQSSFADAGARFSSAAALGMGDFESQVQLNQQQTLASLFENAQHEQLGLLENVLPSIQNERANEGSWMNDVVGGLEMFGGAAVDAFTGGLGGNTLIGAGASKILGGGKGGGGMMPMPGSGDASGITQALNAIMGKNNSVDLTGLSPGGGGGGAAANNDAIAQIIASMQNSGGRVWDPYGGSGGGSGEMLGFPTGDQSVGFPF